ncbi:DUF1614 domain-containing protein [Thermocoleostomius sinensis]|uniref:DUF1614 domain-containing protein n=1 Tax=Thermocoleostomius sinensis A174 TaxID=2016057 RepID=A0A9E9C5L2_9CYAN|nr:DUF1614 domain-containing protein [Thermocoleostomius sinensis]WAL58294.1 DUF1614 domain-containing protein [Thermocoleostomius sinensis A174]
MIYLPVTLLLFVIFLLLFPFIWFAIALDVVEVAVAKLGFSPSTAFLLFAAVILGSTINIPLYERVSRVPMIPDFADLWMARFWGIPLRKIEQKTIVALNVGGGLIPTLLALYEFTRSDPFAILAVTAVVTFTSYFSAQIVPGIGIQMNALVAPLTAALMALLIVGTGAAPVAFAGGVLGTLIGADLLHLPEIEKMSAGVLSIGGAGVFDGIALCGLFALLLT